MDEPVDADFSIDSDEHEIAIDPFFNLTDDEDFEITESSDSDDSFENPSDYEENLPAKKPRKSQSLSNLYDWKDVPSTPKSFTEFHKDKSSASEANSGGGCQTVSDPLDIFSKYFTENFIQTAVKWTNHKAGNEDLTESEFKQFLGVLVIMGFHKLPYQRQYWSSDPNFGVQRISQVISCNRFGNISKNLSFNSQKPVRSNDDLHDVRPLISHFNDCFSNAFKPALWMAVGEFPFKNRRLKYSASCEKTFELWVLCCVKTKYIFQFSFTGTNSVRKDDIAKDLVSPYEGQGCSVVFDRRMTNFPLVEELYKRKVFICAELKRVDPHVPTFLRNHRLKLDETKFVQCEDFSVTKWRKSKHKFSYVLSNMHDPSEKSSTATSNHPKVIVDYCDGKKSILISSNSHKKHSIAQKPKCWTMRVFQFILNAAIANSYVLYNDINQKSGHKSKTELEFRSLLANQLIGPTVRTRSEPALTLPTGADGNRKKFIVPDSIRLDDVGCHFPIRSTSRRCAHCSTKAAEKRSSTSCSRCKVGLCIPCFMPFHTEY